MSLASRSISDHAAVNAPVAALTFASSAIVLTDSGVALLSSDLHRSFGLTFAGLGWVGSSYALTVALLALPAARLTASIGQRRGLQVGLAIFALGTLFVAAAPTSSVLMGSRVLEGIGTAFVTPTMLAFLRGAGGTSAGRGIAWWSGISSSMVAIAPLLAAVISAQLSWRVYFLGGATLVAGSSIAVSRTIPAGIRQEQALPARLVLFASAAFAALDLALIARRLELSLPLLAASASCLVLCWLSRERHSRLMCCLTSRAFAAPAIASLIVNGLVFSVVFLVPLYDRLVLRLKPLDAVISLLVIALPPVIFGPFVSKRIASSGARMPMVIGAACFMTAMIAASRWTSHVHLHDTLPALALAGVGLAALLAPGTAAALNALPDERIADGAAVLACARMLGVGLGAFATSVVAARGSACSSVTHFCLDALSNTLTRPLLFDAGAAAMLAALLLVGMRRQEHALADS